VAAVHDDPDAIAKQEGSVAVCVINFLLADHPSVIMVRCDHQGLGLLLPHLADLVIDRIDHDATGVRLWARRRASAAACGSCGSRSSRVHSRYDRQVADAAIAGRPVVIRLQVRRFFCDTQQCPRRTFVEQVEGLTARHARRSLLLREMLESIGLALAGRAGQRLAHSLGLPAGRDTLLRLVRALPDPPVGEVSVLGVDDFAIKRGQTYATVLLNMATHRPVDVLPDREADTLADWLKAHPEITIITRDRAGAYAEAAARGAPQATQCADRWHVWKNLGDAVEKTVIAHRACLPEPEPTVEATVDIDDHPVVAQAENTTANTAQNSMLDAGPDATSETKRIVVHFRERFTKIQTLRAQGMGIRAIAGELNLDRKTARRFFYATSVEDLLAKTLSRPSLLDEYKPHLHRRFNEGCTDAAILTAEIRAQGYRGSERTVYRYIQPFRPSRKAPAQAPAKPKIRHVTGWIMRDPVNLKEDDEQRLKAVLARCPELEATRRHVGAFAQMIRDLRGDRLPDWMDRVKQDNLPALHSFITGLRQDLAAVTVGLTLPWSNGPTEGAVNRIKMLKRQKFGRAHFPLLRKRILLAQ
jgi:transposase